MRHHALVDIIGQARSDFADMRALIKVDAQPLQVVVQFHHDIDARAVADILRQIMLGIGDGIEHDGGQHHLRHQPGELPVDERVRIMHDAVDNKPGERRHRRLQHGIEKDEEELQGNEAPRRTA